MCVIITMDPQKGYNTIRIMRYLIHISSLPLTTVSPKTTGIND
jgi:hypothetical protein